MSIIDLAGGVSEGTFIDHVSGPVEGTVEMEGQLKQKGEGVTLLIVDNGNS